MGLGPELRFSYYLKTDIAPFPSVRVTVEVVEAVEADSLIFLGKGVVIKWWEVLPQPPLSP
jgi:hypothetical protein